ncbi:MAG: aspartate kinase [Alphaproteobacteria bacterium]|nr:aspartate kinase [Alphaproteobacteria bacterium]
MYFDAGQPPFAADQPLVVKIGGSLTRQPHVLKAVLDSLNRASRPLIAVAGGGALADGVREAQRLHGFRDLTAHRMALLAMHQNTLLMASFAPSLALLESLAEIETALAHGGKAFWLPLLECDADTDLPASWDATSDTIAARLAERLGGLPVTFVKSRDADGDREDPASLAAEELIDPICGGIIARAALPFTIIAARQILQLEMLLRASETVDATGRT